ncbi:ankyrin repeat-containing domain protein [Aspergillus alliaceus]|uniref:Ankyrin repeat-containing domain protein n=1 Tax=Petromyces alliaceus TaxID=209559 RepID=A0A5N6FEF9_PETAA|nr:ankyrin repeat-containing domain protein [Aspergillus alliaceus]KAB8227999.1 ankyrin repeat-containing domain protein [Aspergillus alliaceus]KAE8385543.1 ankyrin repeat-containing domain protein [Aspergillus alliaceus]
MDSKMLFLRAAAAGDVAGIQTEYLKNNTVLTAKDSAGRTALHLAALHSHANVLELLLDYGSDTSAQDNQGQTALHIAAQLSSQTIVKTLLQRSANCCIRDHAGRIPLFYAYQNYPTDLVGCFLECTIASGTELQCGLTPEIILGAGPCRKWTPLHANVSVRGP